MKNISLLGSTGSIGVSTLKVVQQYADRLNVVALVCGSNQHLLAEQVRQFRPLLAVVTNGNGEPEKGLRQACKEAGTELIQGSNGAVAAAGMNEADVVVAGILGAAGLRPTLAAIDAGHRVALANKEVMVLAGELVRQRCRHSGATVLPVDSEHSAIFQCLAGERPQDLDKILLCASGGPFRGRSRGELESVTREQALDHPRWKMGQKITIDSASLMNKALEIIEARWLFDVEPEQIEVVVHPQCIVHSMVEYCDGTIIAQMGQTDMVMPIQYAISYPERWSNQTTRISLPQLGRLDFHEPDMEAFPTLGFSYAALQAGGTAPVVLNAADEIAVAKFLQGRISFGSLFRVIDETMNRANIEPEPALEDIFAADEYGRRLAESVIAELE